MEGGESPQQTAARECMEEYVAPRYDATADSRADQPPSSSHRPCSNRTSSLMSHGGNPLRTGVGQGLAVGVGVGEVGTGVGLGVGVSDGDGYASNTM